MHTPARRRQAELLSAGGPALVLRYRARLRASSIGRSRGVSPVFVTTRRWPPIRVPSLPSPGDSQREGWLRLAKVSNPAGPDLGHYGLVDRVGPPQYGDAVTFHRTHDETPT
ncbi:MAG: hypothetical protein O2816_10750 [Planctomycetota bacterium]|nr:hypothetical protein [Planctomycetota bacterium]